MAQSDTFIHFNVIQHIGCGYSAEQFIPSENSVQLLQQKFSGQFFALKVFKAKQSMLYENEKKIMEELSDCPGVIQLQQDINLTDQDDLSKCILMEYAPEGSIFNLLQNHALPEPIARAYFRQVLTILEQIHKRGIVHRDIKLENLLLDEEFRLKVCDFGFAAKYLDTQGNKIKMNEHVGTLQTAAPELYLPQPYSAIEADLFQMGVILFQICTGTSPFKSSNVKQDPLYQLIYKNQSSKFWQNHESHLGEGYFSKEFKDLLQRLFAYNPNQRLSIDEIKQHTWMQKKDALQEEIQVEMKRRKSSEEFSI